MTRSYVSKKLPIISNLSYSNVWLRPTVITSPYIEKTIEYILAMGDY